MPGRWSVRLPDPLLFVLAGVVAGLVVTWLHHPRYGLGISGLSLLLAAAARLLTRGGTGLLEVRSRLLDVAALGVLGVALIVLVAVIPQVSR